MPIGNAPDGGSRSIRSSRCPKIERIADIPPLVHITRAEVIGDHSVRLTFEDGTIGDVTFDESYWTGVFEPLRDPRRFARVSVEGGTITWAEDGLDMAPEPLYAEARERRVSAAPTR